MSNCKDLPIEILDNIFQRLSKKDNGRCSLTCRAWKSPSQRVLFQHLKLSSANDVRRRVEKLSAAITHNNQHQSLGNYVKTLRFSIYGDRYDIALMERVFPFLEIITIGGNPSPLNDELCQMVTEGRFPNLKKPPFFTLTKPGLELILARKEDITELELYHLSK